MRLNMRTIESLAAVVLGLCTMAPNCPTCGPSTYRPNAAVIAAKGPTKQQFNALPDNAIFEYKGRRLTKGQFLANASRAHATASARREAALSQNRARFEGFRTKFLSDQHARLQTKNARLYAELTRIHQVQVAMSPQRQALERETRDISTRSRNASPAERAQLNQRAAMALRQLRGSAPTSPNIRGPMNNR
jgi:hypothetical protein